MPRADSQRLTPRRVVTSDRTTNTARFVPTNSITRFIFVFRLRPRVTSTQQAQSQIPDLLTFRRRSRQIGADDKRSRRLVGPACANNCPSQKLKTCLCSIRANRALFGVFRGTEPGPSCDRWCHNGKIVTARYPGSDFELEDSFEPGQVPRGAVGNIGDILEPDTADLRIIEAGLDCHDVPDPEDVRRAGAHPGGFMDFQSESMARAVKETLHPAAALAGLIPFAFKQLHYRLMHFRRGSSGLHLFKGYFLT